MFPLFFSRPVHLVEVVHASRMAPPIFFISFLIEFFCAKENFGGRAVFGLGVSDSVSASGSDPTYPTAWLISLFPPRVGRGLHCIVSKRLDSGNKGGGRLYIDGYRLGSLVA